MEKCFTLLTDWFLICSVGPVGDLVPMEAKSNDIEKEGEALREAESVVKKQNVTMAMGVFDCPICSNPLRPPIFQVTEYIFGIRILFRFLC